MTNPHLLPHGGDAVPPPDGSAHHVGAPVQVHQREARVDGVGLRGVRQRLQVLGPQLVPVPTNEFLRLIMAYRYCIAI